MRLSGLIFVFLLIWTGMFGQTILVIDEADNPIKGVQVTDGQEVVYTDSQGKADISIFHGHDLTLVKDGFLPLLLMWKQLESMNFTVIMRSDHFELEGIIISASRWEQPISEVPRSVVPVRLRNITMFAPQTMADLLGTTDKVYIQKSQLGGGSPMIRGFAANRVLIVIDGVRMNNAIYRSGNLQNVISLDPLVLEESEIIMGPASNLYGSDALGGVMDFHTKDPLYTPDSNWHIRSTIAAGFWSADMATSTHVDLSVSSRRLSSITSISLYNYSDLRMGSIGPEEYLRHVFVAGTDTGDIVVKNPDPRLQVQTGYAQLYFMQKLRYKVNQNNDLTYSFHYSSTSNIPRYDRLILMKDTLPKYAQWYYGPQKWIMNSLRWSNTASTLMWDDLRFVVAYQDYTESRHDRKFRDSLLRHRREHVQVYSANLDVQKHLSFNTDLFYGVELVANKVGSFANVENIYTYSFTPASTRYPDGSSYNTAALYVQTKTSLIDGKLTLSLGGRYSRVWLYAPFDTTFYSFPFTEARLNTGALSGSAGIVYKFNRRVAYRFNLSTGFRAPNIDDIGKVFDSEPGSVIVPNPDLHPEYAYTVDNGIRVQTDRLYMDMGVFYTYLDDAIVRKDYSFNGQDSIVYDGEMSRVQALVNADFAHIWGVEIETGFLVAQGLTWRNYFTYLKGFDSEREPLRHVPPMFGSSHLFYKIGNLKSDLFVRFNGEIPYDQLAPSEKDKPHLYAIDANGNPYYPAWWTLNASLKYNWGRLLVYFNLENILDKRYRPYSSGVTGPGRSVNFGFIYQL